MRKVIVLRIRLWDPKHRANIECPWCVLNRSSNFKSLNKLILINQAGTNFNDRAHAIHDVDASCGVQSRIVYSLCPKISVSLFFIDTRFSGCFHSVWCIAHWLERILLFYLVTFPAWKIQLCSGYRRKKVDNSSSFFFMINISCNNHQFRTLAGQRMIWKFHHAQVVAPSVNQTIFLKCRNFTILPFLNVKLVR